MPPKLPKRPVRRAERKFAGIPAKPGEINELIDLGGGLSGGRAYARAGREPEKKFVNADPFANSSVRGNLEAVPEKGFAYLRKQKDASANSLSMDFSMISRQFMKERNLSPSEAMVLTNGLLKECHRVLNSKGIIWISTFRREVPGFVNALKKNGFVFEKVQKITKARANEKEFGQTDSARHYAFAEKPGFEPFMITARKK